MCTTCGCGPAQNADDAPRGPEGRHRHPGHHHDHGHRHDHGPLGAVHAPGTAPGRVITVEQDLLAENNRFAAANRRLLAARRALALNLVSSPGSGKTELLVRTIEALRPRRVPLAVIEGDQQTERDADRVRAAGAPAIQLNTGKGCHLDAHMVGHALERLDAGAAALRDNIVLIENVGNLVCPAAFDLGEAHKVVVLSVTEGEDKPIKYPDMFHAADVMLINKIDLLPYLDFDVERCVGFAREVNPDIQVQRLSARSGEGLDGWLAWIEAARPPRPLAEAAA